MNKFLTTFTQFQNFQVRQHFQNFSTTVSAQPIKCASAKKNVQFFVFRIRNQKVQEIVYSIDIPWDFQRQFFHAWERIQNLNNKTEIKQLRNKRHKKWQ